MKKHWLLAFGVLMVAGGFLSRMPRDVSLLDRASRVRLPAAQGTAVGGDSCQWISDHELLLRHKGRGPERPVGWYRYDIRSGIETYLRKLSDLVVSTAKRPGPNAHIEEGATLSPDGRWLLWQTARSYRAATLDGRRTREWPLRSEWPLAYWAKTSDEWLLLLRTRRPYPYYAFPSQFGQVKAFQMDRKATVRSIHLPAGHLLVYEWDPWDYYVEPVCNFAGGHLKTITWVPVHRGPFLTDFDVRAQRLAPAAEIWPPYMCESAVFSTAGDRIVCVLWPPITPERRDDHVVLSVADGRGRGMREVGHISLGPPVRGAAVDSRAAPSITDVRWVPGGREISFVFGGALWRVPADAGGGRTRHAPIGDQFDAIAQSLGALRPVDGSS